MEIWKDIEGYEGLYQVSNEGRVRSLGNGKKNEGNICKARKVGAKGHKHLQVVLYRLNMPKAQYIHRLVAEAFIPNPNGCDIVHHIDHDPSNNRVENLMWMNRGEHKAMHNRTHSRTHQVDLIDPQTGEVIIQLESEKYIFFLQK
jgi:hypothetical protein